MKKRISKNKIPSIVMRVGLVLTLMAGCLPTPVYAASSTQPTTTAANTSLLQFTANGHILGFASDGVYLASGDHMLRESFVGTAGVTPSADQAAGSSESVQPLQRVQYSQLWPGIDLVYDAPAGGILRSTYTIAPGADPGQIALQYNVPISLDNSGSLGFEFENGILSASAPIAWQVIGGKTKPVDVAFRINANAEIPLVSFQVGQYNPDYPLIIDPTLEWHTFMGGSGNDIINGIVLDGSGNIYVAGYSPSTWGSPLIPFAGGSYDIFIAKLNNNGVRLWHTFLGSSGEDQGNDIVVDASGNLYVTGLSQATWGSPLHAHFGDGYDDAFIVKLDTNGVLIWNTFAGAGWNDVGKAITLDNNGNILITGYSGATWGTPVYPFSHTQGNGEEGFVAKLNNNGNLMWNTFMGGLGGLDILTQGNAISVDAAGNVYVAGDSSNSWGSPLNAHAGGMNDIFVDKLNSSGVRQWHTYMGGPSGDEGIGIAVDGSGNLFVTGLSQTTWGGPINAYGGGTGDAFVAKLNNSGSFLWNTFLGGLNRDFGRAITLDGSGTVYVAGISESTWGSPLNAYAGGMYDIFTAQLDSSGSRLWNTFVGGTYSDYGYAMALDANRNIYLAGTSISTWGSPVNAKAGQHDGLVAKLNARSLASQGAGLLISAGDSTPSLMDLTDFGSVAVEGGQVSHRFDLLSIGSNALNLTNSPRITLTGANAADFTVLDNPYSPIASGYQTDFVLQFDPSAFGLRQATVSIANDSAVNPYTFAIQGSGTAVPEIDVLGKSLSIPSGDTSPAATDGSDFGLVTLADSASQSFTIQNTGTIDLTLSGTPLVELSGVNPADFSITLQPTSPVAPAGSTTFTVGFSPAALGLRQAAIRIANNDSDENPYTFTIQGTGRSAPIVTTQAASGVMETSAALNGLVNPNYDSTSVLFEYGLTSSYGSVIAASPSPLTGASPSDISAAPTGLLPNTTYHFRAVATNTAGTTSGDDLTFTTLAAAPMALTNPATAVTSNGATFNGTVNANNASTGVTFEYGLDTSYGSSVTAEQSPLSGSSQTPVSAAVSGLTSSATYHFRVAATNASDTTYGADQSVTITAVPEMDVFGNSQSIPSGDVNPSMADDTDFGYVATSETASHTFTIQNTGTLALNLSGPPFVTLSGANAADFSVSLQPTSPVAAGDSTTFTVTFTPSADGLRQAVISIANDDSNENPYTFAIQGHAANAPLVVNGAYSFPAPGATLPAGISHITLEFNMDVKGADDPQSANYPGNYLLFSAGTDGFQTVDCAGGVAPTDINIPIGGAFYDDHDEAGPFLANLFFDHNLTLPPGDYRFLACGTTSIENQAGTELNDGADALLAFSVAATNSGSSSSDPAPSILPATGFAPGMVTLLPAQPMAKAFSDTGMQLEIPALDSTQSVVGVPGPDWDVSWLGNQIGYLQGTAFPTWNGNSVLTGHVTDTNGNPGPFANLGSLAWGDQLIIHAWGQDYIYEVRSVNLWTSPNATDTLSQHEDLPWLTLITCHGYDEKTNTYRWRTVVRAVLIEVQ